MANPLSFGQVMNPEEELNAISFEDACGYYAAIIDGFQVDMLQCISFINRMLGAGASTLPPQARALLAQAVRAAVSLSPFDTDILRLAAGLGLAPGAETVVKVLDATHAAPEVFEKARQTNIKYHSEEIQEMCREVLKRHPMAVRFADMLLTVAHHRSEQPDDVLEGFRCPKVLEPLWSRRLFNHHASMGDVERAWPLWKRARSVAADDPISLSQAAEMFHRRGDTGEALAHYARAVKLDPLQRPYARRMEALRTPFQPDHTLVRAKKVCILLYTWNKADMLGDTLQSLAGCDIGPASIKVLLNGCKDHSRAVAEKARALFADRDYEIIDLHVNIGAPAARNWLLGLPSVQACDYAAFLDDDVYLQPDWLAHMLTVAESDPKIGNVGCKVVFPGEFPMLQYLYRHMSIATSEGVRVSPGAPSQQYDFGLYGVIKETSVVMGCQHLLRVATLKDAPSFDIRYSPSQVDDTDHDLQLCLAGWKVMYCGTVTCVHRQTSGVSVRSVLSMSSLGNITGNDVKFHFKWLDRWEEMRRLPGAAPGFWKG
ncbi:hypothetical protein NNJEOMEG_02316 [Fundidesulfovibrio magnetotacticus]|uniref:Glycosyltransferase 2-like domain-containing protein n=1 Tax=Fundidesulfovibrio magnetotacticus TaxID=2730080 RepID=A0A6V8LV53_9BACT|nr:glycosyltransferase [Fundidesulfovibrio magnetotacticus]GFK94471.1 hypothetical protein NNJEOMEG_02316 [Fundidesulfovibrio magnetotacticus]